MREILKNFEGKKVNIYTGDIRINCIIKKVYFDYIEVENKDTCFVNTNGIIPISHIIFIGFDK